MDIRKLQRAIVDGLEDVKGQNIAVFNTEHLSSMFERVIIASGTSNRQTKALASSVRDAVKSRGMQVLATEGEDNGEWIIVDCGAAVAHIMQPAIREYYRLEEIWGGKAVRLKFGEVKTGLVKASEPERPKRWAAVRDAAIATPEPEGKTAARKKPARKTAAKSAGAKKAAPKRPAAKTTAPKRPAAKKAAPRTRPA
ncbi:MAG: ribosome silencing factor [Burkholderiales bacterium]|nr:ribosome silencing factor [Burkholderiales bacterium]MDE2453558.1 ribosome silencing factor [Burkholderiales bacterium]